MHSGEFPSTLVVYGAGGFGQRMARALSHAGTRVQCFVDAQPKQSHVDGVSVVPLAEWQPDGVAVAVGISNPGVDIAHLSRELSLRDVERVWGPVQVSQHLFRQGIRLENYWMTGNAAIFQEQENEIAAARALMADEASKDAFDAVLNYRIHGSPEQDPQGLGLAQQYFPDDIDFITSRMRYVDAGAFDGDTVRSLATRGCDIDGLLALEPDPSNYAMLTASLTMLPQWQSIALPLGLSDECATPTFAGDGGAGSVLSATGNTTIQVVDLDSLAFTWRPTHIKLDIEGAEEQALRGMQRTLHEHRPRVAVSVYHRPVDHWQLPLLMSRLTDDYRYFMRIYGQQSFDTVVYAIPDRS